MNRLLLSCLACLVLYGSVSSGQYQPGGGNTYGAPSNRQDSLNGDSFEGGSRHYNNDHAVRPTGGSSTGAHSDHHQHMGQHFAATSTMDSQPSDHNRNGGDYSGGATTSGGHHGTGGHGNSGTNMAAENATRIKFIFEHGDRIKLAMEGGGMVQIQEVVLDKTIMDYRDEWAVKSCKRGTADTGEGSQREMLVRDGDNGTKRWAECGVDGHLRRSVEPGEVQNQLRTLLKTLHISGGDVRGEGWTEEDRGQHPVKEVELKQIGGGRWIMEVVTGSKREKKPSDDWDNEEEDEPSPKFDTKDLPFDDEYWMAPDYVEPLDKLENMDEEPEIEDPYSNGRGD